MSIKFYYNGIRDFTGAKIQPVFYSLGGLRSMPDTTITISHREHCGGFSQAVHEAFAGMVENETDSMTDYFDRDRIRVMPSHPLYAQVAEAMEAASAKRNRKAA